MMTRLKELESENARLKRMYADEHLKADILQDALSKTVIKPAQHKSFAQHAVQQFKILVTKV